MKLTQLSWATLLVMLTLLIAMVNTPALAGVDSNDTIMELVDTFDLSISEDVIAAPTYIPGRHALSDMEMLILAFESPGDIWVLEYRYFSTFEIDHDRYIYSRATTAVDIYRFRLCRTAGTARNYNHKRTTYRTDVLRTCSLIAAWTVGRDPLLA